MHTIHRKPSSAGNRLVNFRTLSISIIVALLSMLAGPLSTVAAVTPTVTLSPTNQVAIVGGMAQLTATVKVGSVPSPGVQVTFNVTGTNIKTATSVTNSQGQASFSYVSTESGTDTVTATATSVTSTGATVDWIATKAAKISLSPSTVNAPIGSTQTMTATVTDSSNKPVSGESVVYFVQGVNAKSATVAGTSDANGNVTFSVTGTNAGSDTITAFTDFNGNKALDTGEFSDTADATWVSAENIGLSPTAATMYTGAPLTLTATVTDSNNNPVQGAVVTYSISGVNPATGTVATDASGKATFTDSGTHAGIDTVHASVSGVPTPASATIQWISGPATLTLAASDTTPDVNSQVTITATLKDKSGNVVPGVKVVFAATGVTPANGSAVTGATGQATFSYTGSKAGADVVSAFADFNGNGTQDTGESAQTLSVTWGAVAAPSLVLMPTTKSEVVGASASVTAQLTNPGGTISGIRVHFEVSGANDASKAIATDAAGQATFSYNGTNAGTDTVRAWADLNGDGNKDTGEPTATASVTWTSTGVFQPAQPAAPRAGCTYFPQTKHNLCAGFQAYWNQFGGLAIYGFPLTEEFQENGVTVQYFERARFEWHPGAWPARYDVLLGLLGNEVTAGRGNEAPFQAASAKSSSDCTYYAATGHNLCAGFRAYWNAYGGLAVYGYPISEEFKEKNPDTGQIYTVQYFQRARFEWHPGEVPARYDVELGRLGAQVLQMKYGVSYY